MRHVKKVGYTECHPETEADIASLRKSYPQHWPFRHVCVADPIDMAPMTAGDYFYMLRQIEKQKPTGTVDEG